MRRGKKVRQTLGNGHIDTPSSPSHSTDDGLPGLSALVDREAPLSVLLRAIPGAAHLINNKTWLLPTWSTNGEWCRLHLALVRPLGGSAPKKKKWKKTKKKDSDASTKVRAAAADAIRCRSVLFTTERL